MYRVAYADGRTTKKFEVGFQNFVGKTYCKTCDLLKISQNAIDISNLL